MGMYSYIDVGPCNDNCFKNVRQCLSNKLFAMMFDIRLFLIDSQRLGIFLLGAVCGGIITFVLLQVIVAQKGHVLTENNGETVPGLDAVEKGASKKRKSLTLETIPYDLEKRAILQKV